MTKRFLLLIVAILAIPAEPAFAADFLAFDHGPSVTLGGTIDARVMMTFVPDASAQALLPSQLELVPDATSPQGLHPIMLMFQDTIDLHMVGSPLPPFKTYHEIVLIVTGVRMKGGKTVYSFFDKLYLDSLAPTVLGYYFAYPKRLGTFDFDTDSYSASTEGGNLAAQMTFHPKQKYSSSAFSQNYEVLKESLSGPVIANGYGALVCSRFTFDFDSAVSSPIEGHLEITQALRPSIAGSYSVPGMDESPAGGASLKVSWTLEGPMTCEE
jgi:hypothetical protein